MSEFPQKKSYKLNEVCQYTDTQPYVLRFWESEFPQLKPEKGRNGQLVYSREDVELVRRIKQLLHDEECTLESARKALEGGNKRGRGTSKPPSTARGDAGRSASSAADVLRRSARKSPEVNDEPEPERAPWPEPIQEPLVDAVPRQRYQDAVEEIEVLRLQLKEAEKHQRKAETALSQADERVKTHRARAARAGERIEKLLERLS